MATRLRMEKLSVVGELLAGLAHELSNALTAILGYAELARDLVTPGELSECVEEAVKQATRAAGVVDNLLSFLREDESEPRPVSLNDVATSAVDLRRYDLRTNNIKLLVDLGEPTPSVTGRFQELVQVVLSLISNACYAVSQHRGGGTILIRTRAINSRGYPQARLEVLDDGPGMQEKDLGRIFDPLFTTEKAGGGSGLGLSVSRDIVKAHNGRIWGENRAEGGGRLALDLPAEGGLVQDPAPREPASTTGVQPAAVLVVEKDEPVATILERMLARDGHNVTLARDGDEAIEVLGDRQFEALVVDCRILDVSGAHLCKSLTERYPHLANRVITAGDALSLQIQGCLNEAGASVLMKPFGLGEAKHVIYRKLREVRA